jgi:hypothetical protein
MSVFVRPSDLISARNNSHPPAGSYGELAHCQENSEFCLTAENKRKVQWTVAFVFLL